MSSFAVTVLCLAHFKACPIPNGFHLTVDVSSRQECVQQAHSIITRLGFRPNDFSVTCKER